MNLPVEIHTAQGWRLIGNWSIDPNALFRIDAPERWSYDMDWALEHLDAPWASVSLALPLSLDSTHLSHWPAFLLDLLPAGQAREQWLEYLQIPNGKEADGPLLLHAGRAPVGNLRLAHARDWKPEAVRGFPRAEVLAQGSAFLEYMRKVQLQECQTGNDSPYSAADTQGAAPKYLLTQDREGLWWAEGTLPDAQAAAFWLLKYPRGNSERDRLVLRSEAPSLEIARSWGLRCGQPLLWERDILFVPRFDRLVSEQGVRRLGLESLCSALGVAEFGHEFSHLELCAAIMRFSSRPEEDLLEYLGRDVLNLALANTDNHARNTAFLKDGSEVRLSPLFDLCPMELDPIGVSRACRWPGEGHLRPDWRLVTDSVKQWIAPETVRNRFRELAAKVRGLPETAHRCGLPAEVAAHCHPRWDSLAGDLEAT